MADERDAFTQAYLERNVLQHPIVFAIREPDVSEFDLASSTAGFLRRDGRLDIDVEVKEGARTIGVGTHERRMISVTPEV